MKSKHFQYKMKHFLVSLCFFLIHIMKQITPRVWPKKFYRNFFDSMHGAYVDSPTHLEQNKQAKKVAELSPSSNFCPRTTTHTNPIEKRSEITSHKSNVWKLVEAIRSKDYDEIDKLLVCEQSSSILTDLDEANDSPIYTALLIGDVRCLNKIALHIKNKATIQAKLDDESLGALATVVESHQTNELTFDEILNNYLRPLYTTESIEKFMEFLGEEAFQF